MTTDKKFVVLAIVFDPVSYQAPKVIVPLDEAFDYYERAQREGRLAENYGMLVEDHRGQCHFAWSTRMVKWVSDEKVMRIVYFAAGANGFGQREHNPRA